MQWYFYTDTHKIVDSKIAASSNDKQQDENEPGFALASTTGTALYELATPEWVAYNIWHVWYFFIYSQPNQNDGGAFSDNASITTLLHRKIDCAHRRDKKCCSSANKILWKKFYGKR
jgi:hypothetical protein